MTLLQTGIAYPLVQNQVYALPAKVVMAASNNPLEVSQDGASFNAIPLVNGQVNLAFMFVRAPAAGTIITLKEYSVTVNMPGAGGGGGGTEDVVISDASPTLTLIDTSGSPGTRRWQIRINGGDLTFDSQNDAGGSYGRPLMMSVFNGGITCPGPIALNSPASLSAAIINIPELTFAEAGTGAIGSITSIKDSTVNTIGATVAGGGAFHVMARHNGTAWKVIGV